MPVYEYKCDACGNRFEALRAIKDADSPISCKQCQSLETKRKLSRCFSHSNTGSYSNSGSSQGCGSCHGGSCSSCRH